ncbi:hypothetical protein [Bradyrhizobium guangdongense]
MIKRFVPVLGLLLSACSNLGLWPDTSSTPPIATAVAGPPSPEAIQKGVRMAVQTAKLTLPVEASTLRKTDHGLGDYFVCLREANPVLRRPHYTYSVFFDDVYKDVRQSVILENCEQQQYAAAD